jgi:hypothetical protein
MKYVEERTFTLRVELRCEFPDDYQGEEDGYVWAAEIPALASEIVAAAVGAVKRRPGWSARPANRGRSAEDEVLLIVEKTP